MGSGGAEDRRRCRGIRDTGFADRGGWANAEASGGYTTP